MQKNIILSDQDIRLRVRRIAYQIYESFLGEKTVYLVGIANSGYRIAGLIGEQLTAISSPFLIPTTANSCSRPAQASFPKRT